VFHPTTYKIISFRSTFLSILVPTDQNPPHISENSDLQTLLTSDSDYMSVITYLFTYLLIYLNMVYLKTPRITKLQRTEWYDY